MYVISNTAPALFHSVTYCLHTLFSHQSTAVAFDEVDEQSVYLCTGQPLPADITNIVGWMLNENFSTAYESNAEMSNRDIWYQMSHSVCCQERMSCSGGSYAPDTVCQP